MCTYPCPPSYFQEYIPRGLVFTEKPGAPVGGMLEISYACMATNPLEQAKTSVNAWLLLLVQLSPKWKGNPAHVYIVFFYLFYGKIFISIILKNRFIVNKKIKFRISLVAQWLRIHLPMWGTWVQSLIQEYSTCHEATKLIYLNYWALTLEPSSCNYYTWVP